MESIVPQLKEAREASAAVRRLTDRQRADLLINLAAKVLANAENIIAENQKDLDLMDDADPKKDRLLLNQKRINELAQSLIEVAGLPDPTGEVFVEKTIQQGLSLKKIAVPLFSLLRVPLRAFAASRLILSADETNYREGAMSRREARRRVRRESPLAVDN